MGSDIRSLGVRSRLSRFLIGCGGYVFLYAAIITNTKLSEAPLVWTLPLSLLIIPVDLFLTASPRVGAFIYSKRRLVSIGVLVTGVLVAFLLARKHPPSMNEVSEWFGFGQFVVQGLVVGAMVRILLLSLFSGMLRGHTLELQRLYLLSALTLFVCLFPLSHRHREYASPYVLGFALGFFVHYSLRDKEQSEAQRDRIGQNILRLVEREAGTVDKQTARAFELFVGRRWLTLRRHLEKSTKHRRGSSTRLVIIGAAMERMLGQHAQARSVVERELRNGERDRDLDHYLHLHRALAFSEMRDVDSMFVALGDALRAREACLLTHATFALRLAETLPADERSNSQIRERVRQHLSRAVELNEAMPSSHPVALITGATVPVTWTFLLDAQAYAMLKLGRPRFAKVLLQQCIYEDPGFSSPYLHLAEWYLNDEDRARVGDDSFRMDKAHKLAALCLHIALHLEGRRDSLIRTRATEFLDLLDKPEEP